MVGSPNSTAAVGVHKGDIRPRNIGFPALDDTTSGLDWGCQLPVMREVQGCNQHSQPLSEREVGWSRVQGRGRIGEQRVTQAAQCTTDR